MDVLSDPVTALDETVGVVPASGTATSSARAHEHPRTPARHAAESPPNECAKAAIDGSARTVRIRSGMGGDCGGTKPRVDERRWARSRCAWSLGFGAGAGGDDATTWQRVEVRRQRACAWVCVEGLYAATSIAYAVSAGNLRLCRSAVGRGPRSHPDTNGPRWAPSKARAVCARCGG